MRLKHWLEITSIVISSIISLPCVSGNKRMLPTVVLAPINFVNIDDLNSEKISNNKQMAIKIKINKRKSFFINIIFIFPSMRLIIILII